MKTGKIVPITETKEYKERNAQLQAQINAPETKVNIDRSVFQKSKDDKIALKHAKILEKAKKKKVA